MSRVIKLEEATSEQLFKHYVKSKFIDIISLKDNIFVEDRSIPSLLQKLNNRLEEILTKDNFDHEWYRQILVNNNVNNIVDESLEHYIFGLIIYSGIGFASTYVIENHIHMNVPYFKCLHNYNIKSDLQKASYYETYNRVFNMIQEYNLTLHKLLCRFFIEYNY